LTVMENLRQINIEELRKTLSNLSEPHKGGRDDSYNLSSPLIEAASVMPFYDPSLFQSVISNNNESLTAESKNQRDKQLFELLSVSRIVADVNKWMIPAGEDLSVKENYKYTLKDDVRTEALGKLKRENRIDDALHQYPLITLGSSDRFQSLLTSAVLGTEIFVNDLNLNDLHFLLRISDWISPANGFEKMIHREDIKRYIQISELLVSFKHLTGRYEGGKFVEYFRGRASELASLRKFVGVAPPLTGLESFTRRIAEVFEVKKDPMLIHGLGGVGKSTLLAKFILEHLEAQKEDRFPFVYLDFDRPNIFADNPETLLVESARQLAIQFYEHQSFQQKARAFYSKRKMSFSVRDEMSKSTEISLNSSSRMNELLSDKNEVRAEFILLLEELSKIQKRPFLIVLDTFEEVQYKGEGIIGDLYTLLLDLRQHYSLLRIVAAGRAPVTQFNTEQLELGDLDQEAAVGFLKMKGLSEEGVAKMIVKKYGGNPLTLKLAVDVFGRIGMEVLSVESTSKQFGIINKRMPEATIQGILYGRILGHIKDPSVYKLAHPGLVLRFLTPELILYVLAKPCQLLVDDIDQATQLFSEMCKEVSLIVRIEPEKVRHRTDVRKVMLKLIEASQPKLVRVIKKAAIRYYAQKSDLASRAEEIYYHLSVGSKREIIDGRWLEGVQDYLLVNADELPEKAQAYISAKSGFEFLSPKVWEHADMQDQERRLTRRVVDYLNIGMPAKALKVLKENHVKTLNPVLSLLQVKALVATNKGSNAMSSAVSLLGKTNKEVPLNIKVELYKSVNELQSQGIEIKGIDSSLKTQLDNIVNKTSIEKSPRIKNLRLRLK